MADQHALSYLFPTAESPPSHDPMQYYGLLGDYLGGVWGTVIGVITLVVVYMTWRTARRTDLKSKIYQVFVEMLRTHEEIVSSIHHGGLSGRDALEVILSEFYYVYRATRKMVPDDNEWSVEQRIDIAYTITYYGPRLHSKQVLAKYDAAKIQKVLDLVTLTLHKNAKLPKPKENRRFPGHQNRLSHYFRNLFNAYKYINQAELSAEEKTALAQVLRAKLSNYEQALLALNVMSHLGQAWERTGLVCRYWPFKNVPKYFFSFEKEFELKQRFPCIVFEWERQ